MLRSSRFTTLCAFAFAAALALPVAAEAQRGGTTGTIGSGSTGGSGPTGGGTGSGAMGTTMGGSQGGSRGGSMGGGAQAASVTDPQIVAIVTAANDVDIAAGKAAAAKTKNPEVKKFAQQMVTDHTSLNKQGAALAKKLKVKPEENETSRALKEDGKKSMEAMRGLKGAEFDKAYVDNEVRFHQLVLDSVDKTLIPSAQNPELKALLEKARPVIAQHLEHARTMQSSMGGGAGGSMGGGTSGSMGSHGGHTGGSTGSKGGSK